MATKPTNADSEQPNLYERLREVLHFELPDLTTQGAKSATASAKDIQHRRNKLTAIHLDLLRRTTLLRDEVDALKARMGCERDRLLLEDDEVAAGKNAETRNALIARKLQALNDEVASKERKLAQLNGALQAVYVGESTLRSGVRLLGLQVSAVVTRSGPTGEEDPDDEAPRTGWRARKD